MAFPVILVDSTNGAGSDTLCSGAGPATAKTGTGASSTSTTNIDITDTVDLSAVSTAGDAVIYFADTTAGHRRFARITNVTGGPSGSTWHVTLDANSPVTTSVGPVSWAIGGTRATVASTVSLLLFDNNSAAGDAMPGWTVEMQSGHSETVTVTVNTRRAGDSTSGPVTLQGKSGAATLPLLTFNFDGTAFTLRGASQAFRNFELRNSNVSKTASICFNIGAANGPFLLSGLKMATSASKFYRGISSGTGPNFIIGCEVGFTANVGILCADTNNGGRVVNCYVHDCGNGGISMATSTVITIYGNVIAGNTGAGCAYSISSGGSQGVLFTHNTVHNNTGDGLSLNAVPGNGQYTAALIANNTFTNNGGFGINFSGAAMSDIALAAACALILNNNFGTGGTANSSGKYSGMTVASSINEQTLDPQFTNAAGGDYSIGTNLKGLGYPLGGTLHVGTTSSTYSYVDIGAAQRQEAGGGGGLLVNPGLTGGIRG